MAFYLLKRYATLPLKEIGSLFGTDYTSVSASAKRFEEKMRRDKKIAEIVDRVTEKIRKEEG